MNYDWRDIRWSFPHTGWVKLNSNGASKGNPGDGGCGGLIHDEIDKWLRGYTCHIGTCNAYNAEFWGILIDLNLAWNSRFCHIIVESDSMSIINVLSQNHQNVDNSCLLRRVKKLYVSNGKLPFATLFARAMCILVSKLEPIQGV